MSSTLVQKTLDPKTRMPAAHLSRTIRNAKRGWVTQIDTLISKMNVNFAERAHNHNWKLDPIVRSLLDTDFYKLLMLQFIWKNIPAVHVTSEVVNRTTRVRLA